MCEENCGTFNGASEKTLRDIRDNGIPISGEVEIKNDTGSPIPVEEQSPIANYAIESGGALDAIAAAAISIAGEDFATQTTLALIKAQTDNLDVSLSTRATEATQLLNNTELQAIKTALQIIDDWDESDRAKVNTIVGQAGVQAGAGAVSANTQRVVIATDQTAVPVSGSVVASGVVTTRFADFGANATLNVKASAGNVFSATCHNGNALLSRYLQIHNTATVPAAAAVPLYTFLVGAGNQIIIGTDFFTNAGVAFGTGIAFAFSTTKNTYTAGAAADQTTIIQYT